MTTTELPPGAPIPVPGLAPRADDLPLEFKSYTYQSGAVYEGQFLGTKRHGRGYWRHPEGEMYEGEYSEGKQNGLGMYVFGSTGKKYLGQWAAGEMSGEGVYFFNPQETIFYCGGYTQDKKNGNGFYMYDTNMLTIQQWHAGEITQEREATPAERVDCAAKIRDIKLRVRRVAPHILGPLPEPNTSRVFKFPSGAVYTGQYVDHKKQGLGRWTHPEGDMYEGSFDDNRHSGWGVYVTGRSGKKYVGQWTGGLMHGWGIYYFTQDEAEFYIGTYIEDRKEGFGMYHYAETGRSKLQFWSKGELSRESDLDAAGIEMWHDAMRRIIAYVAPYAPSYKSKCPALASR